MPPARASLDILPAELKLRIAELCFMQDEQLGSFPALLGPRLYRLPAKNVGGNGARRPHHKPRPSLANLYQVSREWRRVCTPLRFRIMTNLDLAHPAYEQVIEPSYAPLIRELRLDHYGAGERQYSPAAMVRALARLPGPFDSVRTPYLSDLAPHQPAMTASSASKRAEFASYVNATRIIRAVFGKTARVDVGSSAPGNLQLCGGTPIKELDVVITDSPTVTALLRSLRACTALSAVKIHLHDGVAEQPIEPDFTYVPLKKLSIVASDFTPFLRQFVSLFAKSLEHLELDLESTSTTSTCAFQREPVFPNLRRLDFDGAPAIALKIVEDPFLTALPSLGHLSMSVPMYLGHRDITRVLNYDFQKALDVFAAMATAPLEVSLSYQAYGTAPDIVLPKDLAASAPVQLVPFAGLQATRHRADPALCDPARFVLADDADLDKSLQAIEASLDAMRDQAKWAGSRATRVQLAEIAETLQEWEGLRYVWRM